MNETSENNLSGEKNNSFRINSDIKCIVRIKLL